MEDFNRVMDEADKSMLDNQNPNLVGYEVINQSWCAILKLWQHQVDIGANNSNKNMLHSERIQRTLNFCKNRKKRIAKKNYKEKLTAEFAQYDLASQVSKIERFFFHYNSTIKCDSPSSNLCIASTRDRYMLLQTLFGILRGESVINCDLSDLCQIEIEGQGSHECRI
jgi:hypothetical protein